MKTKDLNFIDIYTSFKASEVDFNRQADIGSFAKPLPRRGSEFVAQEWCQRAMRYHLRRRVTSALLENLVSWDLSISERYLQGDRLLVRRVGGVMSDASRIRSNNQPVDTFHDPGLVRPVWERDVC